MYYCHKLKSKKLLWSRRSGTLSILLFQCTDTIHDPLMESESKRRDKDLKAFRFTSHKSSSAQSLDTKQLSGKFDDVWQILCCYYSGNSVSLLRLGLNSDSKPTPAANIFCFQIKTITRLQFSWLLRILNLKEILHKHLLSRIHYLPFPPQSRFPIHGLCLGTPHW